MLKTPSPIIPIILPQKGGKCGNIYNVLEGFQGILPLRDIYKCFAIKKSFMFGCDSLWERVLIRKGVKKRLTNFLSWKRGEYD